MFLCKDLWCSITEKLVVALDIIMLAHEEKSYSDAKVAFDMCVELIEQFHVAQANFPNEAPAYMERFEYKKNVRNIWNSLHFEDYKTGEISRKVIGTIDQGLRVRFIQEWIGYRAGQFKAKFPFKMDYQQSVLVASFIMNLFYETEHLYLQKTVGATDETLLANYGNGPSEESSLGLKFDISALKPYKLYKASAELENLVEMIRDILRDYERLFFLCIVRSNLLTICMSDIVSEQFMAFSVKYEKLLKALLKGSKKICSLFYHLDFNLNDSLSTSFALGNPFEVAPLLRDEGPYPVVKYQIYMKQRVFKYFFNEAVVASYPDLSPVATVFPKNAIVQIVYFLLFHLGFAKSNVTVASLVTCIDNYCSAPDKMRFLKSLGPFEKDLMAKYNVASLSIYRNPSRVTAPPVNIKPGLVDALCDNQERIRAEIAAIVVENVRSKSCSEFKFQKVKDFLFSADPDFYNFVSKHCATKVKIVTKYFNEEFNPDVDDDLANFLTHQMGIN